MTQQEHTTDLKIVAVQKPRWYLKLMLVKWPQRERRYRANPARILLTDRTIRRVASALFREVHGVSGIESIMDY